MTKVDDIGYYRLICEEVERHLLDSSISKIAHWYAAAQYEKWNKYLGIPATLSAAVLSWMITQNVGEDGVVLGIKLVLSFFILILSGLITTLNLNDLAARHRAAAQRYQQLSRRCMNWKTDFPDETTNEKAKEVVRKYREDLSEINNESPQIPKWAYKSTKKQREEGSSSYGNKEKKSI